MLLMPLTVILALLSPVDCCPPFGTIQQFIGQAEWESAWKSAFCFFKGVNILHISQGETEPHHLMPVLMKVWCSRPL